MLFLPGDQFFGGRAGRAARAARHRAQPERHHRDALDADRAAEDRGLGWRQAAVAQNAAEIRELGQELYKRLGTFGTICSSVGQRLNAAVEAYNSAVGSLERQVLPQARRFTELGVTAMRAAAGARARRAAGAQVRAARSRVRRIPMTTVERQTDSHDASIRAIFTPRADELAGRVIAVTGPTRGIGRAMCAGLRAATAPASSCSAATARLEGGARRDRGGGRRIHASRCSISRRPSPPDYDELADGGARALRPARRPAAQRRPARHAGADRALRRADLVRVMHVNVTAAFALDAGAAAGAEAIAGCLGAVHVERRWASSGRAYWGAYAVSKFAVEGLTQVLAAEVENVSAIRVNAINPGATRTAMRQQAYPSENPETLPLPESL